MKPMRSSPRSVRARTRTPWFQSRYPASHAQHQEQPTEVVGVTRVVRSFFRPAVDEDRLNHVLIVRVFVAAIRAERVRDRVVGILQVIGHGNLHQGRHPEAEGRSAGPPLPLCQRPHLRGIAREHLAGPGRLPGAPPIGRATLDASQLIAFATGELCMCCCRGQVVLQRLKCRRNSATSRKVWRTRTAPVGTESTTGCTSA